MGCKGPSGAFQQNFSLRGPSLWLQRREPAPADAKSAADPRRNTGNFLGDGRQRQQGGCHDIPSGALFRV